MVGSGCEAFSLRGISPSQDPLSTSIAKYLLRIRPRDDGNEKTLEQRFCAMQYLSHTPTRVVPHGDEVAVPIAEQVQSG